jgi:hypothetical protein
MLLNFRACHMIWLHIMIWASIEFQKFVELKCTKWVGVNQQT